MNEMEAVEGSLKQMGENVNAIQAAAVPGLAKWGQDKLDEYRGRWDSLSKQVRKSFCLFALCAVMSCSSFMKRNISCLSMPVFIHTLYRLILGNFTCLFHLQTFFPAAEPSGACCRESGEAGQSEEGLGGDAGVDGPG